MVSLLHTLILDGILSFPRSLLFLKRLVTDINVLVLMESTAKEIKV